MDDGFGGEGEGKGGKVRRCRGGCAFAGGGIFFLELPPASSVHLPAGRAGELRLRKADAKLVIAKRLGPAPPRSAPPRSAVSVSDCHRLQTLGAPYRSAKTPRREQTRQPYGVPYCLPNLPYLRSYDSKIW